MSDRAVPKLAKWPFFLSDLLLLSWAAWIVFQNHGALVWWHYLLSLGAVVFGGILCVSPFLREYRAAVNLSEADGLATTVAQIQDLDLIKTQISGATSQWQTVQEHSVKTVHAAKEIADRMKAETQEFLAFLEKAHDNERSHLRLEVEKLRRTEGEWLQVTVRILDHIYALNLAASRSGQLALISQLAQFQHACRDVTRRVGLVPFVVARGDAFDPKAHLLADAKESIPHNAEILETLATGYSFQGQIIRKALVSLRPEPQPELPLVSPTENESLEEERPLVESSDTLERVVSEHITAS
jgi:molecular chaperone GrpE (heat shock protein)